MLYRRTGADLTKLLVPMWRATLQQQVTVGGEGAGSQELGGQGPSLAASSTQLAHGKGPEVSILRTGIRKIPTMSVRIGNLCVHVREQQCCWPQAQKWQL